MLTSVYYYNHYKPYILKNYNNEKIADVKGIKRQVSADNPFKEKFILNNSVKQEVMSYATYLSGSVNHLRDSSRDVLYEIHNFKRNAVENGLDTAKEDLSEGIDAFVDAYNNNVNFKRESTKSRSLNFFINDLTYDVSISTTALSKFGVELSGSGEMSFNKEYFDSLKGSEVMEANKHNYSLFKNVYDATGDFLTMPLAEHMGFKNLGYYYNYKLGTMEKDSFRLIQSGMIIDTAV